MIFCQRHTTVRGFEHTVIIHFTQALISVLMFTYEEAAVQYIQIHNQ